jgi:acyl-CoA synthetase (AMP-forming)/AMP-acid ligase II/acyl carrier protein
VNLYGSSESSINLLHTYDHQNDQERDYLPIGCPVEDTEVLLVNDAGEHEEFSGEIAIKSAHVALGYWHRPELTDKVFLTDSEGGKTRIYRTGDIGCLLADGNMEFVGRKDFQVKIRGYRVQPEEIADVLREHSLVRNSVIVGRRDDSGELQLIAYVVTPPDLVPSAHELRGFLNMKLPDYMIPSFFVFLDTLPLTPNGKVDWCALPAPDHTRPALDRALVAPRTPMEEEVARIWVEVLGVQQVGLHDNFFELGGHSLKATQIMSRLRDALQVELPLRTIRNAYG